MRMNRLLMVALGVAAAFMLTSCAANQADVAPWTMAVPMQLSADDYNPKINNFVVILDASSSMGGKYQGKRKIDIAKDVLSAMNLTLPEVGMEGALRTFGQYGPLQKATSKLAYGPAVYSTAAFQDGLDTVTKASGNSPMGAAIDAAMDDLSSSEGDIALLVVSDALKLDSVIPLAAAARIKEAYGDRLCIYTILVGNAASGKALLGKIADIGECGAAVTVDEISSTDSMAEFVKTVFLTPAPVVIVEQEVVVIETNDTDGDGVPNEVDDCPKTPAGAPVNDRGCWVIENVLFDFDHTQIKPEFVPVLDEVYDVMAQNPALEMILNGYTDNIGSKAYNENLSKRRANSVKKYLTGKGIDGMRMPANGYGYSDPVAPNDSDAGRALNRRVEFKHIP